MSAPAIELRSVGKQYGDTVALREVSLVVDRGQVFLLTARPPFCALPRFGFRERFAVIPRARVE